MLLDGAGASIHLRPQSLAVLKALAETPGRVVSKDTLVETVWKNLTVSDDSLTQCIADIRRALGDTDRSILRTVPKVGYVLYGVAVDDDPWTGFDPKGTVERLVGNPSAMLLVLPAPREVALAGQDPMLDALQDIALSNGIKSSRSSDHLSVLCSSVDEAADFALRLRAALAKRRAPPVQARMSICLTHENNGALYEKLKALALLPTEEGTTTITLSLPAREHLTQNAETEVEELGPVDAADISSRSRYFQLVERTAPNTAALASNADIMASIAVLPLIPRGPSEDQGMMGKLIADDIISVLSPSSELRVITRLSTTNINVGTFDLASISARLNANFIVSGNYAIYGSRLQMRLELADVVSASVLWSDRIEVDVAEITQSVLVMEDVSARIRRAIFAHETRRALRFPLKSLQNYTLLVSAINLMHRLSKDSFLTSRELLLELVERCPGHPEPLAWIGTWHVLRVQQGWVEDLEQELDMALQFTSRALSIDPDNALSLTNEGSVLVNLAHDLDKAELHYSAALDINPNEAYGRLLRGTLYAFQGKGEAAQRDCELSLRLSPMDPHRFLYLALTAGANLAAQNYERALELAQASYRLNRAHASTLRILAVAQHRLGLQTEARATAQELMRLQPNLRVSEWLRRSPSGRHQIGQEFADAMLELGVPD